MTDQAAILNPLAQVRRTLYLVRLGERAALALICAATVALFVVGGRLLYPRFPGLAIAVTVLPLIPAVWLFLKADRLVYPASALATRGNLTPGLLRVAAILAVVAVAVVPLGLSYTAAPLWVYAAVVGGIFLGAAVATVRPVQTKTAAIFVDQQVGLKEKVSTALEFLNTQPASPLESAFREPVIATAVDACKTIKTAKVKYAKIDRRVYALAATVAIAAVGVSLLTPLPAVAGPAPRKYVQVVQKGQTLAEKLKELEATKKIEDPALEKKLAELRKVAEAMKQGTMSPFEANEKLSTLNNDLQNQKDADRSADVEKALEASKEAQGLADAAKELKTATKSAGNGMQGSQAQRENAENKVKQSAGEIASKLGGMSDKEKKDLANDLKAAAQKSSDPDLKEQLEGAAKAAEEGNAKDLEQKLAEAGKSMGEQGAKQQMSQEAIREAMDQIQRAQGSGMSAAEQQARGGEQSGQESGGESGNQEQNGNQNQQAGGKQNQQGGGNQGGEGGEQGGGEQASGSGSKGGGNQTAQQGGQAGGGKSGENPNQTSSGSTNFEQRGGPGDKQEGGPIGNRGTFVKIYDQNAIDTRGKTEQTRGHINPLGTPSGSVDTLAQGDNVPSTIRTYESELPAARKRALDDLPNQPIPPQMKDLIRKYYDH